MLLTGMHGPGTTQLLDPVQTAAPDGPTPEGVSLSFISERRSELLSDGP